MKNKLIKYRGVVVIATSLIFNLVTSLLVWHPEGKLFNLMPMTITEWICDIICITWFFIGFLMALYDANKDSKKQMEEASENLEFEQAAKYRDKIITRVTFKV